MLPLYTRYLSPAEYGMVELIDLFVMVATMTFGVQAVTDSMVRLYHQYGGKDGNGAGVISTAIWSCAILSGAVLILAVPLGVPVRAYFSIPLSTPTYFGPPLPRCSSETLRS